MRKLDGNLHICGDYKLGVNQKIFLDSYPISNNESAPHVLTKMKLFVKIGLKSVYHQIQSDDNFKEITTVNIPIGLLKWNQMLYRVKITGSIFYKAIENILRGDIKNTIMYQDDIYI